jgi:transketolase
MNPARANLDVFAETLLEIARIDRDVVVVTSDSRGSAKLAGFCKELPQQVVEVGIAEQNLVGVAAGLASAGKKVFAVSPACFLTARALEQIKNDVAYSDLPVKLVGISAGVSYGALGSTHHSLHDLAVLQALNNIDIVVPADNFETCQTIREAMNHPRPLYIRFGKRPLPLLHAEGTDFRIGKALILSTGSDVTLVTTGETTWRAVEAAELLHESGISCGVISVPSLRPFDEQALLQAASATRAVITVEEHSIYGGLGSRCAALFLENGLPIRFKIIGIPDEATVSGGQEEIFAHYGITPAGLALTAQTILEKEMTA